MISLHKSYVAGLGLELPTPGSAFRCAADWANESKHFIIALSNWAMSLENLFMPYANNKGADQRSLISAFVIHYLDSIMPSLAIAEISRPYLVSSAEQAGLSLTWSQTQKTGILVTWLYYSLIDIHNFNALVNVTWHLIGTCECNTASDWMTSKIVMVHVYSEIDIITAQCLW